MYETSEPKWERRISFDLANGESPTSKYNAHNKAENISLGC